MPIQQVSERNRGPSFRGRIRLGIKVAKGGRDEMPEDVHYFVLEEVPEVAQVYGPKPTELEIMFINDDPDIAYPTWLKYFGGAIKDPKTKKSLGGKLYCKGNGPDHTGAPGIAEHFAMKDPKTGIVPTRPCLGPGCSDWDDKGKKCKQHMQLRFIIPRVSLFDVYAISTNSWNSISAVHGQLA